VIRRALRFLRASAGVRASGLLLFGAVAVLAGSYGYNLLCIRWLGPRDYGDVAALTALTTIVLLPLLGVQAALAREVSMYRARGNERAIAALLRLTLRRTLVLGGAAALVLVALAPVVTSLLGISRTASTISAVVLMFVGSFFPLLQAFLQGLERFGRIALALAIYGFGRPLFAMPILLAGFGVAGAIAAGTVSAFAATLIVIVALTALLSQGKADAEVRLSDFWPVVFGLFAFTLITNADVVAAKAFLEETEAGTYASASLVGKVAALIPAGVIAPVLLPRATARIETNQDAGAIVSASLLATAIFGLLLTAVAAAVPTSLVTWTFGEQFADARDLLAPCAGVMTLCGLINVNLTFAFALRDTQLIRLLGLGIVVQLAAFARLHDSPYEILAATVIGALVVIIPHELRSPVAVWRLARAARGRPL
jgi:O-antigen/teichoic acid export membrane protein